MQSYGQIQAFYRYILWYNRSNSDIVWKSCNFVFMNAIRQTKDQLDVGISLGNLTPAIPIGEMTRIPVNNLCFIMITDGEGRVEVDDRAYAVQKGSFIYMLPHHLLTLRSCSDDFRTAYACFTFELLSDFPLLLKADVADYIGNHPCCNLSDMDYAVLVKYYDLLADRHQSGVVGMEAIKGVLFSLIMEVNRIYSGKNDEMQVTHQDKLTDRFFKLLHSHFSQEHSVAFYAQELCVSDKHLMRVIKEKTGQTFHFWLTDFLLRQARQLLLSTDMNVTQIAESLHFPDSSAFAKFFRRGMGRAPLEYKEQHIMSKE